MVAVFVASGLGVASFNALVEWRRHSSQRTDEVEYLAIQLAFLFEEYAIGCGNQLSSDRLYRNSGGQDGAPNSGVPSFPSLPESDAYKLLDRGLLNDVLDFPQRRDLAESAGLSVGEVSFDDDMVEEFRHGTVQMGIRAIEVADKLRTKYKLAKRDLSFRRWDIRQFLQDLEQEMTERERREREIQAEEIPEKAC